MISHFEHKMSPYVCSVQYNFKYNQVSLNHQTHSDSASLGEFFVVLAPWSALTQTKMAVTPLGYPILLDHHHICTP
jgi:hypothetical protein